MSKKMMETLGRLTTEHQNAQTTSIDTCGTLEMLRLINDEDAQVADAVRAKLQDVARAVRAVAQRLSEGGRMFYLGAGTSGRLGILDASECAPTFGVSPDMVQGIIAGGMEAFFRAKEGLEDDPAAGARALDERGVTAQDVLVGITASGRTPFVLGAVAQANRQGTLTVGVCNNENSALSRAAAISISIPVGPEVIQGSTRMKAGTAQKMVLNMLTTGVMIRLGHVYGNLMVEVRPTNEKLEARAKRIIMQATGVCYQRAERALSDSGVRVKTAIAMILLQCDREKAEEQLNKNRGQLSEIAASLDIQSETEDGTGC